MIRGFGTRTLRHLASAGALALALLPSTAYADSAETTLGGVIANLATDIYRPFWLVLLALGFLVGLWLIANGLVKLRDLGGHNDRGAAIDGILRIIGGALLVGLPDCINAGVGTFYNNVMGYTGQDSPVGGVSNCIGATGSDALTCVGQNIAVNVVPIFVNVSFCLLYLSGAAMILHSLYTLATSHSTGHHQMPKGWMARIFIGALVCNMPYLMNAIATTLGVSDGTIGASGFNLSSSNLLFVADGSISILQQYSTLIGYVFRILVMFGIMAVWKGVVYLRAYAEGTERGGMGAGMTHIIGGVALANAKWTTCIIMNTAVGSAVGFCS